MFSRCSVVIFHGHFYDVMMDTLLFNRKKKRKKGNGRKRIIWFQNLMQIMNTPDYVVRPKITVVKSKTRGTDSARTRIDRDESNQFQSRLGLKLQLQQFVLFVYILWLKCFCHLPHRETEGEGSSGSSSKSDDQFVKVKTIFFLGFVPKDFPSAC